MAPGFEPGLSRIFRTTPPQSPCHPPLLPNIAPLSLAMFGRATAAHKALLHRLAAVQAYRFTSSVSQKLYNGSPMCTQCDT